MPGLITRIETAATHADASRWSQQSGRSQSRWGALHCVCDRAAPCELLTDQRDRVERPPHREVSGAKKGEERGVQSVDVFTFDSSARPCSPLTPQQQKIGKTNLKLRELFSVLIFNKSSFSIFVVEVFDLSYLHRHARGRVKNLSNTRIKQVEGLLFASA